MSERHRRLMVNCPGEGSRYLLARRHWTGRHVYLQLERLGTNSHFYDDIMCYFL